MKTRIEIQARIKVLRDELETRYKSGIAKLANNDQPIPTEQLQDELYKWICRLARMDEEEKLP